MKRYKTEYKGVFYRLGDRIGGKGKEKIYYIVFKSDGKIFEEKVGRQYANGMTPAKASLKRSDRIEGRSISNKEKREQENALKLEKAEKKTIEYLWKEYKKGRIDNKSLNTDKCNFTKHIEPYVGSKEPQEIIKLDIERINKNSKDLSPQTQKHILALLKRIVHHGVKEKICLPLQINVELPKVDNLKTEDLNPEQLNKLLEAINASYDIEAKNIMLLALFTGMRRGEIFKLKWNDIDFDRGFINIINPKGGKNEKIPLNEQARKILDNHPKTKSYVFVTNAGKRFVDIGRRVNRIKEKAGLPEDFRPLHGLRHYYASSLASSGLVDLYTLQKLLTHKSPIMTQRYAHLRDEALKTASTLAGNIIVDTIKNFTENKNNSASA